MLSLLSGQNRHLLLQPRYWSESIECLPLETASWGASWGISPGAAIDVIPPLAGFVGSDLLSGVLATGLMEHGGGALLIDFGTNSEVALWDGNKIWVTSAAGGPAFEGCGISCGMPAEPGAIYRVYASDETGELAFEIVADAEPRGLCGSGMVDLLACLVRNRTLNKKGQFASSVQQYGFPLRRGDLDIVLTKRDIRHFPACKGRYRSGCQCASDQSRHRISRVAANMYWRSFRPISQYSQCPGDWASAGDPRAAYRNLGQHGTLRMRNPAPFTRG